jgi:hypothetical protein
VGDVTRVTTRWSVPNCGKHGDHDHMLVGQLSGVFNPEPLLVLCDEHFLEAETDLKKFDREHPFRGLGRRPD